MLSRRKKKYVLRHWNGEWPYSGHEITQGRENESIQEVLRAVSGILSTNVGRSIDLNNVDLSGIDLKDVHLENIRLWGSRLRKANLARANLRGLIFAKQTYQEHILRMLFSKKRTFLSLFLEMHAWPGPTSASNRCLSAPPPTYEIDKFFALE
jgi:hypothetical protein